MQATASVKHITAEERQQVERQVKEELVEHLYRGCVPGTITGVVASIALFADYWGYVSTSLLVAWMVSFNLMMVALSGLYFFYTARKSRFTPDQWENSYSVMMCGCALSWVPIILMLPADSTRAYLALIAYFLATTGYATGTIGQFRLCVATLNIMILPLIVTSFYTGGLFYNIIGVYSLVYMLYMIGANLRSTIWFKDSLKLKLENTLVSYQANHDLLTNLPNQRLLPQFLDATVATAKDTNKSFALICFSLNRLEMINDSLGHVAGNSIIQAVAGRLAALASVMSKMEDQTKITLTISRTDTFNIIMSPINVNEANEKIKILFSVLDEPFYLQNRGVKMTASIGVSFYPSDGIDSDSLLINADAAMLKAKQYGGNHLEFYRKEINAQLPKQIELENDLHSALENNQLQVYYQPLVEIGTGRIIGSEALLRWPHPVHGFISPVNFIPLAEETGLIVPIGAWVLQEACRQTKEWQRMGYEHLSIAVNLSEKQLRLESIIDTIHRVLIATEFDANNLELEITETGILDEKAIPMIKEFTKMGIRIAVDDFGTGYSGLSYLKRFSIDKLKIDQSFIRDIPGNNDSITIVSAIIAMAKELNVKCLAEGVETKEQLEFLTRKGCDYIQGYYFSKPLEASFFTRLLLSHGGIIVPISQEQKEKV